MVAAEEGRTIRPDSGIGINHIIRTSTLRKVNISNHLHEAHGKSSDTQVHNRNIKNITEMAYNQS